jgi:beta-galactosidase
MSRRTSFSPDGLTLGETTLPFFSGSIHYWRHHPKNWSALVQGAASLGVKAICSYVPWSIHESKRGFDFGGALDVAKFAETVAGAGLHFIARPGPHINAELTGFGFPDSVLTDPAIQAQTAQGTPAWLPAPPRAFPIPSYASSRFQQRTEEWLESVGAVLAPLRYPEGPMVAVQLDNEFHLFFRLGAFDLDYHPGALEWWQEYSGDRAAPRSFDLNDQETCLLWVRFKEEYARRSLLWLKQAYAKAGLDEVAHFHNAPPSEPELMNLPATAAAVDGPVGIDFYHKAADYTEVRRRAIFLSSTAQPPISPEIGLGAPYYFPPMSPEEQQNVVLGCLAGGVRGMNFYMLAGRERWYGGALDEVGKARPEFAWLQALLTALDDCAFHTLRRRAPVAVVMTRCYARMALATSAIDALTPVGLGLLGLGPAGFAELATDEESRRHAILMAAILEALDLAEVPYQIVDEEALHQLGEGTRVVIAPTLTRVDGATWAALHAMASAGVQIVCGPGIPESDELGRPLGEDAVLPPRAGRLDESIVSDREELAAALLGLAGDLGNLWISPEEPAVHVSPFEDEGGAVRAVFVGNSSNLEVTAAVNMPGGALVDCLSGERIESAEGVAEVVLEQFQVRMFALENQSS